MPQFQDPRLLVSGATMDDAGVYKLNEQQALVQTVDFFTPMVDDPYVFGQVAAANALSDIYAMGGRPLTALNIAAFDLDIGKEVIQRILAGGAVKLQEAGCLLVGGHTIEDKEPKYGLAVTGLVHPDKLITNAGAQPGARVVLTKPLGSGILSTALKGDLLDNEGLEELTAVMTELNDKASAVMQQVGVLAATDITGFGLLGHAWEICASSGVGMELQYGDIPVMDRVVDFASMGVIPAGAYKNKRYLEDKIEFSGVPEHGQIILCDPQTSGGLLIVVEESKLSELTGLLQAAGIDGSVIGTITDSKGLITVTG